jgi:hypothetical protein
VCVWGDSQAVGTSVYVPWGPEGSHQRTWSPFGDHTFLQVPWAIVSQLFWNLGPEDFLMEGI